MKIEELKEKQKQLIHMIDILEDKNKNKPPNTTNNNKAPLPKIIKGTGDV